MTMQTADILAGSISVAQQRAPFRRRLRPSSQSPVRSLHRHPPLFAKDSNGKSLLSSADSPVRRLHRRRHRLQARPSPLSYPSQRWKQSRSQNVTSRTRQISQSRRMLLKNRYQTSPMLPNLQRLRPQTCPRPPRRPSRQSRGRCRRSLRGLRPLQGLPPTLYLVEDREDVMQALSVSPSQARSSMLATCFSRSRHSSWSRSLPDMVILSTPELLRTRED